MSARHAPLQKPALYPRVESAGSFYYKRGSELVIDRRVRGGHGTWALKGWLQIRDTLRRVRGDDASDLLRYASCSLPMEGALVSKQSRNSRSLPREAGVEEWWVRGAVLAMDAATFSRKVERRPQSNYGAGKQLACNPKRFYSQ
ncbi:MAG: hypothetical protein ACRD22_12565 [Terriglobia bacterium]